MSEEKTNTTLKTFASSIKKTGRHFFAKVVSFQNMFVPEKVDKQKGLYFYGFDNRLPNKLMSWVLDSGTAKKAQAKRATYIAADGFLEKTQADFKINQKQTANELLDEISGYQSYFKGFALKVIRDGNRKPVRLEPFPFQDIRKKTDGSFIYNPTLSSDKYDKSKEVVIAEFKSFEISEADFVNTVKTGELIYAYKKSADNPQYPIPDYYAGIEDIRSSSELQKFDYETVMNAFITSAMLTIIGEMDDTEKDEGGMTERDYIMDELEKFTGEVKDANGVSGRMRMLIMTAKTKDHVPVLTPFDAKVIIDASNSKREIIDRAVCRLFAVHPVLIGFADAQLLGNMQALANASNELANDVLNDQLLISETLKKVFPDRDWKISRFRPIQYVPDALLSKLTDTEQRALIGYPELKAATDAGVKLLTERLGVGGTQSLVAILSDTTLKPEQKRAALKLLFGLSDDDTKLLVPDSIITTPPAA
jgi:hypothetical protein